MKPSSVIGIVILAMVWIWLSWGLLTAGGVNLKNILILGMTGIIIFVPLYKKYSQSSNNEKGKHDKGRGSSR